MYKYNEDNLIEQPTKQLFAELNDELQGLNAEARELEERIGANVQQLLRE